MEFVIVTPARGAIFVSREEKSLLLIFLMQKVRLGSIYTKPIQKEGEMQCNSNTKFKKDTLFHSIPIIRFNKLKSNVLSSIPSGTSSSSLVGSKSSYTDSSNSTDSPNYNSINTLVEASSHYDFARSASHNEKCLTNEPNSNPTVVVWWRSAHRDLSLFCSRFLNHANRTRASQVAMTPASRIGSWAKVVLPIFFLAVIFTLFNSSSCFAAASVSLSIDGNNSSKTIKEVLTPNKTTYVGSNITYNASDTESYAIKINYANGSTGLKLENGSNTISEVGNSTASVVGSSITNAWGYAWTDNTSSKDDSFYASLPYYGISNERNVEGGTSTTGTTTKQLIFAANLADTNPTGSYKANVVLSLTATPKTTVYTLNLDANGGTGGTTKVECPTYTDSCTVNLADSNNGIVNPARTDYTIIGWSDNKYENIRATYSSASNSTITLSSANNNKTIYAVWQYDKLIPGFTNITNMHQMSSNTCKAAATWSYADLTDARDGNIYRVVKMPDGSCWMTENLRIIDKQLDATYSDVTTGHGDTFAVPASKVEGFSEDTVSNAYFYPDKNTAYYSWCAATAGTCTEASRAGVNAPSSICPKNWYLPTGLSSNTSTNDFRILFLNMGLTISNDSLANSSNGSTGWGTGDLLKAQSSPYNFNFTGYMSNSSTSKLSTAGSDCWSRTAYNSVSVYNLNVGSDNVYPGTNHNVRRIGLAVRCVAYACGEGTCTDPN